MDAELASAIGTAMGARVAKHTSLAGGDINRAHQVELDTGRRVFVKTNPRSPKGMFQAEARGLEWLREADAIRIPRVIAVSKEEGPQFLVLELIESARGRVRDFDERLGRGLAVLHRFAPSANDRDRGASGFGLDHDNFIGRLPQANASRDRWGTFYAEQRLLPQLAMATQRGVATHAMKIGIEAVCNRIDAMVGPDEPPCRLHGDLWGGNLHVDDGGQPALIDPAAYAGHREVDLAMMRLFGGFGDRVFSAYDEAFRLADGHQERVALYQLYPLLVHVNLFGGSYVASVERTLTQLL